MVYQDNLLVTLNSKNATLNNSTMKSNVNFNFISLLKDDNDILRTYVSVLNAQIPISFYVINSSNNKLIYNNFAPNTQVILTVPVGNYNAFTLATTLTSLFLSNGITISITTNTQSGIMTFIQFSSLFTIYAASSLNLILGIGPNNLVGVTIVCVFPVNLLGVKKIYIKSNELAINSASSTTYGFSNTIVSIPVDYPYFSMISYINTTNLNSYILKTPTVDNIDIQLTDEDNNLLDFNNLDWTITLCLSSDRVDKEKDLTKLKDILNYPQLLPPKLNTIENSPLSKDQEELNLLQK